MLNTLLNVIFAINQTDMMHGLNIFWKGMLAVMIVLLAICLVTFLINYISHKLADRKNKNETPPADEDSDRN